MKKIRNITIFGVGLIGGSLGLTFKKNHIGKKITGFGRNINRLKLALKLKAVDNVTTDLKEATKDADLIVLALPVKKIIEISSKIYPFVKKGCIIIDAGSTKEEIVKKLSRIFSNRAYFVGVHPLAGSHKSGVVSARPDLFTNSICVITPIKSTNKEASKTIELLFKKLSASIVYISPSEHDKLIAKTSHLPHLIASVLTNTVLNANINTVKKLIATGFKDTTRISASNPALWSDICFTNKSNILKSIDEFEKHLAKIKNALKNNQMSKLVSLLESAKIKREQI